MLVQPGVVLSYRVVIDRQHTVPAYSRISLCQQLASHATLSEDELEYATTPAAGRTSGVGEDEGDWTCALALGFGLWALGEGRLGVGCVVRRSMQAPHQQRAG